MAQDPELRKFKRNLRSSRREILRAVERAAEVDMLRGHRVEALRLARACQDAAEELVRALQEEKP